MDINEKLEYILTQQSKGVELNDIADALELKPTAVRAFMTRQGYSCKKGVFHKKDAEEQIQLILGMESNSSLTSDALKDNLVEQDNLIDDSVKSTTQTSQINSKINETEQQDCKEDKVKFVYVTEKAARGTLKLTPEFIDHFDEMRDWFLDVKDLPQLKHKVTRKNKEVFIDNDLLECESFEKTKVNIESECMEKIERLCKNSNISKDILISQALREFLKTYKHLI